MRLRWPREYENPRAGYLFEWVRDRFAGTMEVEVIDLPQRQPGLVSFELEADGARHLVAVDYYDYTYANEEIAPTALAYFKMQHREEGYEAPSVVPGGYVAQRDRLYRFLGPLRATRDRARFAQDVYGRFSTSFQPELRGRIAEMLSDQRRFGFEGGTKLSIYSRHLRDVARSRVCIDVPGQGPYCHRLIDYLAIGACVVGIRPKAHLPVELEQHRHVAWVRDDLGDLVETCARYVEDAERREAMARASRDYFDRYLRPEQLADYYLTTCLERLGR
jgi:hypothetical protein